MRDFSSRNTVLMNAKYRSGGGWGGRITIQMSYNLAISIHKEILEPWRSVV